MTIITHYKENRIEADSWAAATSAIARLQAEESHLQSLADYRDELPEINFENEELSA